MAIYKSILPNEYQQVEYIESSGTQYIDSGVAPSNPRIVSKVKSTTTEQTLPIFGCYNSSASFTNSRYAHLTPYASKWYYGTNNGENNFGTYTAVIGTEYIIDFNNNSKIKVNNDETTSSTTPTTNGNILISARSGAEIVYGKWQYYYFKIYDNGTLVRNFVPCYRKSDSVIGLYDLVNNVFYTNSGTGTFTKGNDVLPKVVSIYKGTNKIVKIYKGTNVVYSSSRLPSSYQEVEYIESSGTQYIDTGVVPDDTTGFLINFNYTSSSDDILIGQRNSGIQNRYWINLYNNSRVYPTWNTTGTYWDSILPNTTHTISFNYNNDRNRLIDNGNNIPITDTFNLGTAYSIYLFGANINGSLSLASNSKVYSLKISSGTTLIRNFVPCYRKADNEIGLYDMINDVFYTNAGTGTFTKGGNV